MIKDKFMEEDQLIRPGERVDDLQRNGYRIIQDPGRFCFGMDAVLLAGFAGDARGERLLDIGTGTGILPLLMEARTAIPVSYTHLTLPTSVFV